MIIIETCPKCGHDLVNLQVCTYPPIPRKECWNCGWSWEGEREEVVRQPFGGNNFEIADNNFSLNVKLNEANTLNSYATNTLNSNDYTNINGFKIAENFSQSACESCSNNPKNGGNGICHCTLGQIQFT